MIEPITFEDGMIAVLSGKAYFYFKGVFISSNDYKNFYTDDYPFLQSLDAVYKTSIRSFNEMLNINRLKETGEMVYVRPTSFSDIDIKAAEVLYALGYRYITREDDAHYNLTVYTEKPTFLNGLWRVRGGKYKEIDPSLFMPLSHNPKEPLSIAALMGKEDDNE